MDIVEGILNPIEIWIKKHRDKYYLESETWSAIDHMLEEFREDVKDYTTKGI